MRGTRSNHDAYLDLLSLPYHPSTRLLDSYDAPLAEQRRDVQTKTSVGGCRHPNVGNRQLAHIRTGGLVEQTSLGERQRQRRVGADAGLIGFAGSGVEPGWQIDGQNRRWVGVRGLDQESAAASRWTAEAETEQSIDDQVGLRERRRLSRRCRQQRNAERGER